MGPPGCTHTHKSPSRVHIHNLRLLLCIRVCVCVCVCVWAWLLAVLRERGWAWLHDRWLLMNHTKLTRCLPDECLFALLVSLLWRTEAACVCLSVWMCVCACVCLCVCVLSWIIHWQYLIFWHHTLHVSFLSSRLSVTVCTSTPSV